MSQSYESALAPDAFEALILAFNVFTLSIEDASFPEASTDAWIFGVIKFTVTFSLAVVIISSIEGVVVPFELSVTVLKTVSKIANVHAFRCSQSSSSVIDIVIELSFVRVSVIVFEDAILSFTIFEGAFKGQVVSFLLAISMPEVVLKSAVVFTILGLEISVTVGATELDLTFIKISVFHNESARAMRYSAQERAFVIASIEVKIFAPAIGLAVFPLADVSDAGFLKAEVSMLF